MVVCSTAFVPLGRAQLSSFGCPDLPMAVIPHPFGTRTREEVRQLADRCVDDIARLALGHSGNGSSATGIPAHATVARAAQLSVPDDLIAFNEECERRRWSDGLPLIPPTLERVERMLRGTHHSPRNIIAKIAPGFGDASVERIAINAVMAGCRPEYLPVLIAAVEAVTDQHFNLQAIQATTHAAAPWIVVNGPVASELSINSGINCLGQGAWANATLGRALRLILQNIGGALPNEMDRSTQGQPGKYTFCCAENESDNPWSPLHVERGFELRESVVTVVAAGGTLNLNTHTKDADDLLRVIADSMTFPAGNDYHFAGEPWLVLAPEHASVLHRAGLSKLDVKRQLWEKSKMLARRFAAKDFARASHTRGAELGVFSMATMVPISAGPEGIGIIVAGGPGTHSVYIPTFGQTRAISRRIVHAT